MNRFMKTALGFVFVAFAVSVAPASSQAQQFQELSQLAPKMLKLQVMTQCKGDTAVFRIANMGDAWPKTSSFQVFKVDGQELITERRLRLTSGQRASFKVKKGVAGGEVGLWIKPGWYDRPFRYDAKVVCE